MRSYARHPTRNWPRYQSLLQKVRFFGKIKGIIYEYMKYFRNINLFQESKPTYYRKNEDELWDKQTPVDTGIASAEQIIKDFDARTDPEVISLNHPDEVVFKVRKMMGDTFRGTNNEILSARGIHNERVINRLRHVYSSARGAYQHILDEEYRRRANNQTWSAPWQRIKFAVKSRRSIEEEIAGDFFTFDIKKGRTHENLRRVIQDDIVNLEDPKNGTFLDANNEPINLRDLNATNEYVVAVGDPGKFRNERVIVRWHDDDYFKIRSKLERAGLWGEFSRSTPENRKVREFIHLKFRLSLLDKIVAEEKTKLSSDRFNTQRLQTWLDNDESTQALHDPKMEAFIVAKGIRTSYASFEELKNKNPDLHREFSNKLDDLRKANKEKTLKHYLSRILPPEELAHMHDSLETRTMLAYLQGAAQDSEQGMNVRNYLRKLAGVKDKKETISKEEAEDINDSTEIVKYFSKSYRRDFQKRKRLERKINDKNIEKSTKKGKAANAIQQEIDKLESRLDDIDDELVDKIWDFLTFLSTKAMDPIFNDLIASGILSEPMLQNRPSGSTNDFFNAFNKFWSSRDFFTHLRTTLKALEEKQTKFNLQESGDEEVEPTKMDSRSLLTSLMKLDLKRHGVSEPEKLNKHALFAATLAIARLENSESYGETNQHIVDDYERSTTGTICDSISATKFFSPVLSAKDAIEHVVDTDPDLTMFSNINKYSTRNDLKKIIDKYGVGSAKLKEFIAKLGACIKGIEVSPAGKPLYKKTLHAIGGLFRMKFDDTLRVRLISSDAPKVENLMNTLTLLFAECSTKNYYNEAREQAEIDPSKTFDEHYLDMIRQQTADMRELNNAIEEDLEQEDNPFKTHLDFYYMRKRVDEAYDAVGYTESREEETAELLREGVSRRELKRGFWSLRSRRFFRKSARVGLTGLSLPFYIPYGVGLLLKKMGAYYWKGIFMTEGTKKGGRIIREHWKAIAETPHHIAGIPLFALSKALSWPTRKFREINIKMKD